jgi:CopG family nickel-responsive transcriptional regulator
MHRVTITLDDDLMAAVDGYLAASNATNRSEAIRDLLRRSLENKGDPDALCMAVASYVLDPDKHDLGKKVPKVRQDNHTNINAAMSVPVGHSTSLEVAVLNGTLATVESIANGLFLERGVRHGQLMLIPLSVEKAAHSHSHGEDAPHRHYTVLERF